jgi:hypothetical protein
LREVWMLVAHVNELCELDLRGAVNVLLGLPFPEGLAGLGDCDFLRDRRAAVWRCLAAGALWCVRLGRFKWRVMYSRLVLPSLSYRRTSWLLDGKRCKGMNIFSVLLLHMRRQLRWTVYMYHLMWGHVGSPPLPLILHNMQH